MAGPPPRSAPRRSYRSPLRADRAHATRTRILAAARAEFLRSGYGATTMRALAQAAGVSVARLEQAFGTKALLLQAAIAYAIRGDAGQVPMLERDWAARAAAEPELAVFLERVAEQLAGSAERSAGLIAAALEGAAQDATLGGLAARLRAQRRESAGWIVAGVRARAPLRPGVDPERAIDTVWLLMDPRTFIEATQARAWTSGHFARWFADAVARLLTTTQESP
jgi:AcrR family transcriptional regulator